MTVRHHRIPHLAVAALAGALVLGSCSTQDSTTKRDRPRPSAPTSADVPDLSPQAQVITREVAPRPLRTAERPNLLMITVDDAAMKDMPYLPSVQKLITDQGVEIANGVAPTPICVPARASILTGQYAHNHGAWTINGVGGGSEAFRAAGSDQDTLPVWLQQSGYDTMFLGKYLNGYNEDVAASYEPPGWSIWRPTLDPTTYNYANPTLLVDGEPVETHTYSTTVLRDQSLRMIRDHAETDKPWYLWVNYVAPHSGGPREPGDPKTLKTPAVEDRDRDTFADLDNSKTPDMFERDVTDKVIIGPTQRRWSAEGRAELRETRQQRIESLQSVDRAVRATVASLRKTGQLDSTYIVFTSDNGFALGEHNLAGKLIYFNDILHVPMMIRGPGIPRGVRSMAPVTNADWAPTLAALAGATPGSDVDGVDVMPWLTSKATRRVIPIEAYPVKGGTNPIYHGATVGPWTYVQGRGGREELYDRTVDKYQLTNVRKDPRFHRLLTKLRRLSRSADGCAASSCPTEFMR